MLWNPKCLGIRKAILESGGKGYFMSDAVFIALLSSVVTAVLTTIGTHGFDRYKNYKNTNLKRMSVLNALNAELTTLKALIEDRKKGFEASLEALPPTTLPYIPISYNYFSVFDNLSTDLGLISTQEVSKLIITTYIEIKGLFENVKDLGNKALYIHKLSTEPGISSNTISQIRGNEEQMMALLLNKQAPKILQMIDTCTKAISNESERVQNSNGFCGFLFSKS